MSWVRQGYNSNETPAPNMQESQVELDSKTLYYEQELKPGRYSETTRLWNTKQIEHTAEEAWGRSQQQREKVTHNIYTEGIRTEKNHLGSTAGHNLTHLNMMHAGQVTIRIKQETDGPDTGRHGKPTLWWDWLNTENEGESEREGQRVRDSRQRLRHTNLTKKRTNWDMTGETEQEEIENYKTANRIPYKSQIQEYKTKNTLDLEKKSQLKHWVEDRGPWHL